MNMSLFGCNVSSGALLLGFSCLLLCFFQSTAHSTNLFGQNVCDTLNVGHRPNDGGNVDDVSIKLVADGKEGDCYEPDTTYDMVITSTGKSIRGLLVLQDGDKIYGQFPAPNVILPGGLVQWVCGEHSVSHNCVYSPDSTDAEREEKCNLGTTITLPYRSPSDRSNIVEFRYSIVFKVAEFLEDKKVMFPACAPVTEEEPTMQEPVPACSESNYQLSVNTKSVLDSNGDNKVCPGNPRSSSNESRIYTDSNNQTYTCTVMGADVRKKSCSTGCEHEGRTLCCKVESISFKNRDFRCVPHDTSAETITKKFTVRIERKCVCYHCSDVCPRPTLAPEYSSGESTTENNDNDTQINNSVEPIDTNSSL